MSLLTRHEAAAPYDDAGEVPPARPVRRRWWMPVAAVVALALAWVVLPSAVRLGPDAEPVLPVDAGLHVPEYGEAGTYALHYRHGEEVTISVPVSNDGPLPLRLSAADLDSGSLPLLVQVGDNLPVRLGPWDDAELELTFRFDNCRHYHERSAATWDHVAVGGSVLGRDFAREIAFTSPLALHGQVINNCPDRTLTRGDDVRPR